MPSPLRFEKLPSIPFCAVAYGARTMAGTYMISRDGRLWAASFKPFTGGPLVPLAKPQNLATREAAITLCEQHWERSHV